MLPILCNMVVNTVWHGGCLIWWMWDMVSKLCGMVCEIVGVTWLICGRVGVRLSSCVTLWFVVCDIVVCDMVLM